MMSTKKAITLDDLKELKELKLSQEEAQEALQDAVTLIEESVKAKDAATAQEAYQYAKYWGDDKENFRLFEKIGEAIAGLRGSLSDEVGSLTKEAGLSFAAKQYKKAKALLEKILAINPKDNAIVKRIKEVELIINPPAKPKEVKKKSGVVTVSEIAKDVEKVVDKLTVIIQREQKTGKSVARLVKAKSILARMAKKTLVE